MELEGLSVVRERCKLITPYGRWYIVTFERVLGTDPSRKDREVFPIFLEEDEEGLIQATYADGSRETFVGLDEVSVRFESRVVDFVSDDPA